MKVQNQAKKITYSPDADILMIQLSNKKVDDSYDSDQMIVQVDETGEPVILEILNGLQFLKDLNKSLPKKIQSEVFPQSSYATIAHRIK